MAEATSTPRITAQYLDNYVGRNVMLIGKVLQLRGDSAVLDADGNVTAILNRDVHLTNGNGAQIIGKVNPDLSIKVLTSRDLGPGVDYQLAAAVPYGRVYGRNQVTIPSPSQPERNTPRALVTRPATTTPTTANSIQLRRQQQHHHQHDYERRLLQQQTPPPTQRRPPRYIPPTPTPPSPSLTRYRSITPIPLTYPPSPQTQERHASTIQASQQPRKHDRDYRQSSTVNHDKRTSIPYRPSRTAIRPPTPPSPDVPTRPSFASSTPELTSTSRHPQIKASSEISSRIIKAREGREVEEVKHCRQRSKLGEPQAEVKEVVNDDLELLGAILDGIGRMAVGTVAMRMDDAGRWRIRRDPGEESD
ncbi:replication factor A protein 3 [Colletotrichum nymphaeae SA-01]|uniref:Replication factor A protein 3 n=1 Tax=Colletotrichum nymphaeae SA-01 TaxID=1460502 RepID=A0A135SWJ3_9PEZI|nr:replication factor A protein 3 [Colletotrichum nymphaeae SA-01]